MRQSSQFSLLAQRRFAPFFWTQFLGALNDNVFKTALLTILTYDALHWTQLDSGLLTNLIPGLFILPFLLFSATAGQLADKMEKSRLVRYVKLLEIVLMGAAAYGWMTHHLWLLVAAVAGMGLHSAIFGPVKYAYLPQQLKQEELVGGNGVIEMGTFVGILLGEIFGAVLVVQQTWGLALVAGTTIGFAVLGWLVSLAIPHTPAPAPGLRINWNPFAETARNLGYSRRNRLVFLSILGNSWFWFYGAIMLAQFPLYAKNYLRGDHSVFVLLLTIFSLGIGAGSLLCERLSGRKIEIGLVPFGAIGLSLSGIGLYFASVGYGATVAVDFGGFLAQQGSLRILFACLMIGVFGGLYIVPLFALIQTRCDPQHVSRTIAGMNIMNSLFMVIAAVLAMALLRAGFTIPEIFLTTALLNVLASFAVFSLAPEFLQRFLAWLLIHTSHRVRTVDAGRIPAAGAAVLVCHQVSDLEAVVIMAASPRPMRFVMERRLFSRPLLSWMFRTAKAIPIAPSQEDPRRMAQAVAEIDQALQAGELVCIFADSRQTRDSAIDRVHAGIQTIIERTPAPVVPMALRAAHSRPMRRGCARPFQRAFRLRLFSCFTLAVGEAVAPSAATPEYLLQRVRELRGGRK